jgi:small subunit ribosomal protein S2
LIIPANNKGKKALATLFWLLTREIFKERGKIKSDEEFEYKMEDFEGKPV